MIDALRRLLERRAEPLSPTIRRAVLAVAIIGLLAAMAWAWDRSSLTLGDLEWAPIAALVLIAAPLSLVLKAGEFTLAARIAGLRPSRRDALEISVVSAAANLLPLPGSLLVTVQALASDGAGYGRAIGASAVPAIAWLGVTGVIGGGAIAVSGPAALGAVVLLAGIAALVGAALMFRSAAPADGRAGLATAVVVVEVAWLAVSGLRFTLAAAALGVDLDPSQALALSVAGAATVAIGFVPGGLGVREALIAALAPLIGLDVETGILLGVVDRVVWLGFLGLAGLTLSGQPSSAIRSDNAAS